MNKSINYFGAMALVAGASLPMAVSAATLNLSGTDASGYASLTNFNNEFAEPNTPDGKVIGYPWYFDAAANNWKVIVAEPLSASNVYAQASNFTINNAATSDADFANFNLGSIEYDESLVAASGESTIAAADVTITIDASELNPMSSPRNTDNEFAWTYTITLSNVSGNGLTFVDGQLSNVDIDADVAVQMRLLDNPQAPVTPDFTQAGAFSIDGTQLSFSVDQTQDVQSFLGGGTDVRLVVNRAGTVDGITPVTPPPAGDDVAREFSLSVDNGSRWYEYGSGSFYELGTVRADNADNDGAWAIADLPAYTAVGGGDKAFPTTLQEKAGTITYNNGGLTGAGVETAAIKGVSVEFGNFIAVRSVGGEGVNVLGAPYTTSVTAVNSGSVEFTDGAITGVSFSADVTLTYVANGVLQLPYSGTLVVNNGDYTLNVDDSANTPFGPQRIVWAVSGDLTTASDTITPPPPTGGCAYNANAGTTDIVFLVLASLGFMYMVRRRKVQA